jgi:hypothetical protein
MLLTQIIGFLVCVSKEVECVLLITLHALVDKILPYHVIDVQKVVSIFSCIFEHYCRKRSLSPISLLVLFISYDSTIILKKVL